ncbi:MAG: FG-GAP-like repeat-containing protein [Woeseiaceae bacterium]
MAARNLAFLVLAGALVAACSGSGPVAKDTVIAAKAPLAIDYEVRGNLTKKLVFDIDNPENYASLSLYANDELLIDTLNVPKSGNQKLDSLVRFGESRNVRLSIKANNADVILNSLTSEDIEHLDIPIYRDISVQAGLDKVSSIKYGGPTVADIDNDGDYDFIVNNHNAESSKLYWNNGDGTVTRHSKNLARWFMHDLHGTAAGDYDNDGDLDIVVTQGGGNGTNPSKANFYENKNGTLVLMTGDVGIDRGGRGRGAKWSDMDLDGDLDLMLVNEASLAGDKPQHFFYANSSDGTFQYKPVEGLQDEHASRALITDINSDNIDDVALFGPLSVWQGNGNFSFTDVTSRVPEDIANLGGIMAVADIDIDNDGDLDLYLARGKEFELGHGEAPSVDHDPLTQEFAIKPRGFKGVDKFDFDADGTLRFHEYYFLAQGAFRGKDYPVFLGSEKSVTVLASGEELDIRPEDARGWPEDISENGIYFGHVGDGHWKAALVRNDDLFWGFRFSLSGVTDVSLDFVPENRNIADVLLRNDGESFVDVSREWNIPPGGNSLGVTTGDFNNDSFQDIFVYRWGSIGARISDLMLLNDGTGRFHSVTMHGASDVGGPGNGDMGQAFDFDLDGDLDLLSGSEFGEWYLFENQQPGRGNYALVRVGYSPKSNVDAIAAEVVVKTATSKYRKRVGSSGAVFSQSLLNIIHFGLGDEELIESITVRWRDGETVVISDKKANSIFSTDSVDPESMIVGSATFNIRKTTTLRFDVNIKPDNANRKVTWSSSNDAVLSVDEQGMVTALGDIGETAVVTATSQANGLSASTHVTIVEWYAVPVESVSISSEWAEVIAGQTLALQAIVLPANADDSELTWSSSDASIASVDRHGVVTAIRAGHVTIKAESNTKSGISDAFQLKVKPLVAPFIRIVDEEKLRNAKFVSGDNVTLDVDYHAGSGNTVISSDEGGIRFWLRHFKSEWIPVSDTVLTDASVLGTESGSSSMTISLEGLTPTAELPEGHFYQLRASFASSDGSMNDATVYPIKVIEANE